MDLQIYDWFSLAFRWFHVITAIAWIGASFYFIWLDNSLEEPPKSKKESGIKGDLWAFHGGGIYEVSKYKLAPKTMPSKLHWFKWEAYATWISGTILLCLVYYLKADLYLVPQDGFIKNQGIAILASIFFIVSGVLFYETVFRIFSLKNDHYLLLGIIIFISMSCYIATILFSNRAAFLHVGALIASIMAANVFFGIIPAQKGFISDITVNKDPKESPMLRAKLRSVHNNYFTLPVIFCMISNHYSFIYGHPLNWLILIYIIALTAYVRHYFNLKHKGERKPAILVYSVLAFFLLIFIFSLTRSFGSSEKEGAIPSPTNENIAVESTLLNLSKKHCASCHQPTPTQPGFTTAPLDLNLHTIENIIVAKDLVHNAVKSQYMPLANITNMTSKERELFLQEIDKL